MCKYMWGRNQRIVRLAPTMEQSAIAIARNQANIDKAPRLCIRIIIWILPSDICQLNKNISKY